MYKKNICHTCNKEIPRGSMFCPGCGNEVSDNSSLGKRSICLCICLVLALISIITYLCSITFIKKIVKNEESKEYVIGQTELNSNDVNDSDADEQELDTVVETEKEIIDTYVEEDELSESIPEQINEESLEPYLLAGLYESKTDSSNKISLNMYTDYVEMGDEVGNFSFQGNTATYLVYWIGENEYNIVSGNFEVRAKICKRGDEIVMVLDGDDEFAGTFVRIKEYIS